MTDRLKGEVAIVTGSTSGLGKEIARMFGAEGARVVVTGRSADRGLPVMKEIVRAGGAAAFIAADLADEEQCRSLVEEAATEFGPVTVLVNNAVTSTVRPQGPGDDGVPGSQSQATAPASSGGQAADDAVIKLDGPAAELTADALRAVLEIDLVGAASLCRFAIPYMRLAGHGSIVNVSSRVAAQGTPNLAAYTASKGALEALARSITADYAREGIRANTVRPGYIIHERRDAEVDDARLARLEGMHLTRLSTATDVAYAVLFFASKEAETISGVCLPVDGGSSAVRGLTLG
jgi:NAD(P)-dependent dehydrogenase (short-subunit alcohol dehydrogenase family)